MTEKAGAFRDRPLLVLALGGNGLSPPATTGADYAPERRIVRTTGERLNRVAGAGYRLLLVHGNGPQVGRLLGQDPGHRNLDIHIAQTQGELGYLLASNVTAAVCLVTRVTVAADPGPSVKPVGPVLGQRPAGHAVRVGDGWRLTVPSPRPLDVLERDAIRTLLETHHVIAGGGGGIPLTTAGQPVPGVVDKDWVAQLLAVALGARQLVFATDVAGVYHERTQRIGEPIGTLSAHAALELVELGIAAPGSMAPKLESAAAFAEQTGRLARICALEDIESALDDRAGTRIGPEPG